MLFSCTEDRENFVFILVDDLGWTDLAYSGSSFYETPNIDELSKNSIIYDNAYSSGSVCSPSRASILTGKHPARINITDWIPGEDPKNRKLLGPKDLNELPLEQNTIAEILGEHGYVNFFAGKWHLGCKGFFPEDQGFHEHIGGNEKGHPVGGYYTPYKNPQLPDGPDGEYLTDRLTDEAIGFLDSINDKAFFLFLTFYSVHTPIQASKRHLAKFQAKKKNIGINKVPQKKEHESLTTTLHHDPAYASMIYTLDENVGRLIAKLKEKNLYENSTIIFTSDNGGLSTEHQKYNRISPTSIAPLRAGKGWLYEGGIRVPLLIKPAKYMEMGEICSSKVIGHDFYPTILARAGIHYNQKEILDGLDISKTFESVNNFERDVLVWYYPHYHDHSGWTPGAAIRYKDWKLIHFFELDKIELFDLSKDISEENDLSNLFPEKLDSMRQMLYQKLDSMNAEKVTLNPNYKAPLSK